MPIPKAKCRAFYLRDGAHGIAELARAMAHAVNGRRVCDSASRGIVARDSRSASPSRNRRGDGLVRSRGPAAAIFDGRGRRYGRCGDAAIDSRRSCSYARIASCRYTWAFRRRLAHATGLFCSLRPAASIRHAVLLGGPRRVAAGHGGGRACLRFAPGHVSLEGVSRGWRCEIVARGRACDARSVASCVGTSASLIASAGPV